LNARKGGVSIEVVWWRVVMDPIWARSDTSIDRDSMIPLTLPPILPILPILTLPPIETIQPWHEEFDF
jgi:hypothetical protein